MSLSLRPSMMIFQNNFEGVKSRPYQSKTHQFVVLNSLK